MLTPSSLNDKTKPLYFGMLVFPLMLTLSACNEKTSIEQPTAIGESAHNNSTNLSNENQTTNQTATDSQQNSSSESTDLNSQSNNDILDVNSTNNKVIEYAKTGSPTGLTLSINANNKNNAKNKNNLITYSLTNDAEGRFSIDAKTGVITVANGELLEKNNDASHAVTALAKNSNGTSLSTTFNIVVEGDKCGVKPNQPTTSEYTISWDNNHSSNLTGYKVYYSTSDSFDKENAKGQYLQEDSISSVNFIPSDLNLKTCTSAYIAVAAIGNRPESALSEVLEIFIE